MFIRYLEYEEKRRTAETKQKEEKKVKKKEQQMRRKMGKAAVVEKQKGVKVNTGLVKKQNMEGKKASEIHLTTHCVICDNTFETASKGYYRFSLNKSVNDDMDVGSVMEVRFVSSIDSVHGMWMPNRLRDCIVISDTIILMQY